jgi:hypothetical protein
MTNRDGFLRPSTLYGKPIPDHDGIPVTRSNATITGLEGGFSEAAAMDPIHVPLGMKVCGLWWGESDSHEYDRPVVEGRGKSAVKADDAFTETTVYKAEAALLIDPDLVMEIIKAHNERVAAERDEAERQRREAKGEFQLPFANNDGGGGDENQGAGDDDPE